MGQHLVLVGGGHAHLGVILQAERYSRRGHRVTVVSPAYHDYSGMGPGLLSGQYPVDSLRFDIGTLTRNVGGQYVEATVVGVEPRARRLHLSSGASLTYDAVSFNTGSSVPPLPADQRSAALTFPVKPINNLLKARDFILQVAKRQTSVRILVVGGGPAGCEVAGNIQALAKQENLQLDISLVAGQALMRGFSDKTRQLVLSELMRYPLSLHEGGRVVSLNDGVAKLDTHHAIQFDILIQATGVKPSGPFKEAGLAVGPNGGLSVNARLHTTSYPEIFAGGDCLFFQPGNLPKVGVHAVRQSSILADNLLATLESRPLHSYHPQGRYLLILNLGLGRAVATGYGLAWRGKSASLFKAYLDRRFVQRFQALPVQSAW